MSPDILNMIHTLTPLGVLILAILSGYVNTKLESIRLQVSTMQECLRHLERNADDLTRRLGDWQLLATQDQGAFGARLARLEERSRIVVTKGE
jgi:hypothetical protein